MKNRIAIATVAMCKLSLIAVSAMILFSGCLSIKPAATKSGKAYYETFFVGQEGVQYFIKPLDLQSISDKNEKMALDFTFRYNQNKADTVSCNFHIMGGRIIKQIDSFVIKAGSSQVECKNVELLFNEKRGKQTMSRFSATMTIEQLGELFKHADWTAEINIDGRPSGSYKPTKSSMKAITTLDDVVFDLF